MSSSHLWAPCMPQHFAQITLKEPCFTRKSHAKSLQSVWRCTCLLENLACKTRTHSSLCFPRGRLKTWHPKQELTPVHVFPGAVWKPGTQNKNSFQSMFSQGAGWKPGMQNKNSFQSICPVHVFPGAGKGKNTGPHAGENVDNTTENSSPRAGKASTSSVPCPVHQSSTGWSVLQEGKSDAKLKARVDTESKMTGAWVHLQRRQKKISNTFLAWHYLLAVISHV